MHVILKSEVEHWATELYTLQELITHYPKEHLALSWFLA